MLIANVVREFVVGGQVESLRGIAFDGNLLYITKRLLTLGYNLDTVGNIVSTVNYNNRYASLAYDHIENVLWAGTADGNYRLFKVALDGTVLASVNYSSILDPSDNSPDPGNVAGITIDAATNTIYFGQNVGNFIYNISKFAPGDTVPTKLKSFKTPPYANVQNGPLKGITSDGINLWIGLSEDTLVHIDTNGNELDRATINDSSYLLFDIEYDASTFAPKWVIWTTQSNVGYRVRAYELSSITRGIKLFD